jgi:ribosomal protein L31
MSSFQLQLSQMLVEHPSALLKINSLDPAYVWVYYSTVSERMVVCCSNSAPADASQEQHPFFLGAMRIIDTLSRAAKRGVYGPEAQFKYRYTFAGGGTISLVVWVVIKVGLDTFQTSRIFRFNADSQRFTFDQVSERGEYKSPVFGSLEVSKATKAFLHDFDDMHERGLKRAIKDHQAVLAHFRHQK